jgi:hypothetical protein
VQFQIGDRVDIGHGHVGAITGTEILGPEPAPSPSPALAAAAHNPGALVCVVRFMIDGEAFTTHLEEDEIRLAAADDSN